MTALHRAFFNRPVLKVAPEFLGKFLVRRYRNKILAGMITEVEAYDGPCDKASHARCGLTARNRVMFGPSGFWYVYFTYGMHWMLNAVTGREGYPAAVLVRSIQYLDVRRPDIILNGPGKLTRFLKIDKKLNGKVINPKSGLWVEDRGVKVSKSQIKRTPRIGVHYAEEWKSKPYRFIIADTCSKIHRKYV